MLESMSSLQLSLAAIGALTVGGVVVYNYWSSRKNAPRQADPHRDLMPESVSHAIEPVLDVDAAVLGQSDQAREPVFKDTFTNLNLSLIHISEPTRPY